MVVGLEDSSLIRQLKFFHLHPQNILTFRTFLGHFCLIFLKLSVNLIFVFELLRFFCLINFKLLTWLIYLLVESYELPLHNLLSQPQRLQRFSDNAFLHVGPTNPPWTPLLLFILHFYTLFQLDKLLLEITFRWNSSNFPSIDQMSLR